MTRKQLLINSVMGLLVVAITWGLGRYIYRSWQSPADDAEKTAAPPAADAPKFVQLPAQARKNLGLISKPLQLTNYWRKIDVPGVVTDRPGISDRGVVAPITGVITNIHAYPGNTVPPDAPLFSLRLASESLHTSQLELFKAAREIEISKQQKQRLEGLVQSGGVAGSRILDIENQMQRAEVSLVAFRQDLLARGLPPDRVEAVARGEFVTEIVVRAPGAQAPKLAEVALVSAVAGEPAKLPFNFELNELKVELGQQVEAGTVLCVLADHRNLFIEGHGFKKDLAFIQRAAQSSLPIEVIPEAKQGEQWPAPPKNFKIHHVANIVDRESRTIAFYLPLENQFQAYAQEGGDRLFWRFRSGDRLRIRVAVEELEQVFVLPPEGVVREGPEAFVYRQNGDLFERRSVHVLHEDGASIVIANDGALRVGHYVAQNSAASLNRVLKSQSDSGGLPPGAHVHADGTVHMPGAH